MSIVAVSKMAGVSIATVSRVINNSTSVSPATAEAVRRAIEQAGYSMPQRRRRNGTAGDLGLKNRSITLLFPDPSAAAMKTVLSGRLSHGISQELAKHRISFVISSLSDWDQMPRCIEERLVDGVIIRGTVPVEQLLPMVRPLKCVTVFETLRQPSYGDQVLDDSSLIGELASTYLLGRGARRLLAIGRDPMHPAYSARADAFVRSCRFAGYEAETLLSPAPYGELVDRAMSGSSPAFDGCFVAGDDRDAVGVYSELKRRGVQIGTNFQFISTAYDPSRINVLDPSLDHIDIRPEEIGRLAVELMLWRFQNPSAERQRRLVEPVLVRSSNARN